MKAQSGRPERRAATGSADELAATRPRGDLASERLHDLQRSAGNRAVGAALRPVALQRLVGPAAELQTRLRHKDGAEYIIERRELRGSKWTYRVRHSSGRGKLSFVKENDKNYTIVSGPPRQPGTGTTAGNSSAPANGQARSPQTQPQQQTQSQAGATLTVAATTAVSVEQQNLARYDRISVIDPGGPGTGHQNAVVKLLESIARVGYTGLVTLNYRASKTRIYANKFGKGNELRSATGSYALYHQPWDGQFRFSGAVGEGLRIHCIPQEAPTGLMTAAEQRAFTDLRTFWTTCGWPGAGGGAAPTDPQPAAFGPARTTWAARNDWRTGAPRLAENQQKFQAKVFALETGASTFGAEVLEPLPPQPGARTLTAFGAMDMHVATQEEAERADLADTYFRDHWVARLQQMTGEQDPVAIICQPFLWTKGHPMQVRGGGLARPVDLSTTVSSAGGKAAYGWRAPDAANDEATIAALGAVERSILADAKADRIHLATAYYGGPVSKIGYRDLLKVLTKVFQEVRDDTRVVIALLGDEDREAHKEAAREINSADVGARTGDDPLTVAIELAHIGRTTAMAQYQRYSELFITEGANTWQELLTLGTPTLSANPEGNTQPWASADGPGGAAADLVRDASAALIRSQAGTVAPADLRVLADFIRDLRQPNPQNSQVCTYFNQWATLLSNDRSDQVLAALRNLPS